jgi:hypothetical protein
MRFRYPGEALGPAEFGSPDVTDELLNVGCAADAAGQLEERRVIFEKPFPEGGAFFIPNQQFFEREGNGHGFALSAR